MSDDPSTSDPDRAAADRVDARQLAFVALAFVALVVAAFLAPTVAVPADGGEPEPSGPPPGQSDAQDSRDGPTFDWLEWLRWLLPRDDEPSEPRCTIALSPAPEPGAEVTVAVRYDDAPLADAPVWLEDRRVGRTDDRGQVTGEVPYVRELSIRVGVEGAPDCRAETGRLGTARSVPSQSPQSSHQSHPPPLPSADVSGAASPSLPPAIVGVAAAQEENSSVSVDVNGEMELDVRGEPYPGEELGVRATINGRPVPDAEVTVDGDPVARTDDDGTATVTVPDDGREELVVRAARGEFAAGATLDVLLLEAALDAPHLAVVPGADAIVVATFADRPARDAVVTFEGERRGETDAAGRLDVALPADPAATVRVESRGQTATVSVVGHYRLPAALVGLLVVVGSGFTWWRRDARAAATVVAVSGGLIAFAIAVVLVDAFLGATARSVLLAAACALVVAAGLFARRGRVADGAEATRGLLARVLARLRSVVALVRERSFGVLLGRFRERLLAVALRIAAALGAFADAVGEDARNLLAAVRSLPRSVTGLLAVGVARLRSAVSSAVEAVRTSPLAVAALLGATVVPAGGHAVAGPRGLAVAAAVVLVAGLLARRFGGTAGEDATTTPGDEAGTARNPTVVPEASIGERSFRELWRAFARSVVPGAWRTSTPEEVARAAVEQGYPRGPVEELTALFREVEYGGRTLSASVRDRAAAAYERLRGGGEGS